MVPKLLTPTAHRGAVFPTTLSGAYVYWDFGSLGSLGPVGLIAIIYTCKPVERAGHALSWEPIPDS